MPIDQSVRQRLRERFNFRCGYCGVREIDHGSELEIEHFQPRAKGGTDDFPNLVYACTACNRAKAAYWPDADKLEDRHLLHPLHDNITQHIEQLDNSRLEGLTKRGHFHIAWLQLNRPQLVQYRHEQLEKQQRTQMLQRLLEQQRRMQTQIDVSQTEIERLYNSIERLRQSIG